jgi:ATP-dependent DNA helicase RecG
MNGTIVQIIEDTNDFLKIYMREKHEIRNFEPEVIYEIPMEALREAVVNAIAIVIITISSPKRILIFTDRIEVHSPGRLPIL